MTPYALLVAPFLEQDALRRALVGCLAIALGGGPVGTLLVLRRMSLMGDSLSHAVLPGVAVGFLLAGPSIGAMSLGGLVAGLAVALLSGLVARLTPLHEDASFAAFYLISLALGVLLVSRAGRDEDLVHILFGNLLGLGPDGLLLLAGITTVTLLGVAVIYRPLIVACFDPQFLRAAGGGTLPYALFLGLVVLNLIGAFQAMGTLMALGLIMLPAAAARFWARQVWSLMATSAGLAVAASLVGLLIAHHADLPAGATIVLVAGAVYLGSVALGTRDSLRTRYLRRAHLRA
ncbi:MAG: metal ABC transporter permease [Pseudomonadota bacterium]